MSSQAFQRTAANEQHLALCFETALSDNHGEVLAEVCNKHAQPLNDLQAIEEDHISGASHAGWWCRCFAPT